MFSSKIIYTAYGKRLAKLLNKERETFALRAEANSDEFLFHFFKIYPDIFKQAVPGTLIIKINGAYADSIHEFQTGDFVFLELISIRTLRQEIKKDLKVWLDKIGARESVDDFLLKLEKDKSKNPDEFSKKYISLARKKRLNEHELVKLQNLMFKAWSSFPKKHLGRKSESQMLHKELLEEMEEIDKNIKDLQSKNNQDHEQNKS